MSAPPFRVVKDVYLRVLAAPPNERDKLLVLECRGDPSLEAEVRSLLANDSQDGAFLAEPVLGPDFSVAAALAREAPQFRAGDYQVTRMIGAGAMGLVYRAVHEPTGRTVALKVLRPGAIGSTLAPRLLEEAALLRRLDHPGIAQFHDAGLAEVHGERAAFVAMELVEGLPLLEHVRAAESSVRGIVALMAAICDAVQHAHERGVVHNDLKPANVLVTYDGTAKVVDFGIAQLAAADATSGGTLGYVAPERLGKQPAGGPVADVYALGAICYELLGGRPPFGGPADAPPRLDDPATAEPWPLGALRPELRGPLETIVHHALDPRPSRRCPSAGFLARDLRRYLAGEPVHSPAPGAWRRFRRFARHHRSIVGGVTAVFVALLTGLTAVAWSLRTAEAARAEEARQRTFAERMLVAANEARDREAKAARRANTISEYLTDVLRAAAPGEGGARPSLESLLVAAATNHPATSADDPGADGATRQALGLSLFAVGRYRLAADQLATALELAQQDPATNAQQRLDLQVDLGIATLHGGKTREALRILADATGSLAERTEVPATARLRALHSHALAAFEAGRFEDARALAARAIALADEVPAGDSRLLAARGLCGLVASTVGDHRESAEIYEACFAEARARLGDAHPQTLTFQNNLALQCLQFGDADRCEELLLGALHGRQRLLGDTHPDTLQSRHNLATLRNHQQRFAESIELHRDVLQQRERTLGDTHPKTLVTLHNLARLLARTGRPTEAEQLFRKLLTNAERGLPANHWQTSVYRRNLARLLHEQGRDDEALRLLLECDEDLRRTFGGQHEHVVEVERLLESVRKQQAR